MNSKIWQIVAALIIGFLAGIGTMQATLVADVRDHEVKIAYLEKADAENCAEIERRIDNVVALWKESVQQSTAVLQGQSELISLVKQSVLLQTQQSNNRRTTQ